MKTKTPLTDDQRRRFKKLLRLAGEALDDRRFKRANRLLGKALAIQRGDDGAK